MSLICMKMNLKGKWKEWFRAKTLFETKAEGNWEMEMDIRRLKQARIPAKHQISVRTLEYRNILAQWVVL